ncbi:MAG: DUF937 domain-containing protein [Vicinamibacterales bacterium]
MNVLDVITNAQGGAAVRNLGSQLGLDQQQTASALSTLLPALAAGVQRNLQSEGGFGNLVSALAAGNHQEYIDNPASLNDPGAITDGNGILGHVLGSKEVSREVANRAAAQTGISADVLKRMLPLAAALMMGASAQKGTSPGTTAGLQGSGGGIADMLGPLLDRNRDGSMVDDVTGMLGRFLGRS